MANQSRIESLCLSQEDLLRAGCLDMGMAMEAADRAVLAFRNDEILFPEKIVQIFNQETQERINCLPATLLSEKVRGVKWVSFFPENPERHGVQNLYAVIILSEIEMGPHRPAGRDPVLEHACGGHGRHHRQALRPPGFEEHRVRRGGRAGQDALGRDLAYVDVAIAYAMYRRASEAGHGTHLSIQDNMIFQHEELADWIRV